MEEFAEALTASASRYGVSLGDTEIELLCGYYRLLDSWNARLHLVAPCRPAVFATRHVLESLIALRFLAAGARVVDVGSGAGLPVIPCLIARPDLRAVLIESSTKKAIFLSEALRCVARRDTARVVAERFEDIPPPEADVLTCRALERFAKLLPALVWWAAGAKTLLLFGGPALREKIESLSLTYNAVPMPDAGKRFLFVVQHQSTKRTPA